MARLLVYFARNKLRLVLTSLIVALVMATNVILVFAGHTMDGLPLMPWEIVMAERVLRSGRGTSPTTTTIGVRVIQQHGGCGERKLSRTVPSPNITHLEERSTIAPSTWRI